MYNSIALIGGDKRQLYCAKEFLNDGYKVTLSGFDKLKSEKEFVLSDPFSAVKNSDIVVLPLPLSS